MVWEQSSHHESEKEVIVDFRGTRIKSNCISIMGEEVEVVEECKYMCSFVTMDWTGNVILMVFIRKYRADFTYL